MSELEKLANLIEELEDYDDLVSLIDEPSRTHLLISLAVKVFPPNTWLPREIKMLEKMGLSAYFGLEDGIDENDDDDWKWAHEGLI